jgi:hypothetical protein
MACSHFPTVSGVCVLIHSAASLAVISTLYGILTSSCSLLVVATLFRCDAEPCHASPRHFVSVHRHSPANQLSSTPISAVPFLVIARPLCAVPLPYCTQLFHCLSTDRRPAPFHSYASQILSIALLCRSSPLLRLAKPFHRFAIPGLASPFRCVAVPGSSIPYHRSTVQCNRISSHFVAIPSLNSSLLFHF